MIKLYNTPGRKLEEFKSLTPGQVKLYTCGPTVYDYQTIGNFRTFIFDDTLRRMLEASGYTVEQIMNITDVGHLTSDEDEGEDKLEKGAAREGKTVREVADHYTEVFKADWQALNLLQPKNFVQATDYINEQIALIRLLMDKGFAYQTEQAIYFDTSKLDDYGKLSGQSLDDKEVGARAEVVTDSAKKRPQDFAVWFFTVGRFEKHEMHWESPWGDGFPGWHLECSAIIHATLGEPIDIHTGGVDHIGTHHTNEIAQTETGYGHTLANYWLHGEFLMVDSQKMAKSAGNFYRLKDLTDKKYPPMALRLLFLQSHYRSQMNFTWEALDAAQAFLDRLYAWADLVHQPKLGHSPAAGEKYEQAHKTMLEHLQNDLNSAEALSLLAKLADESEKSGVNISKLKELLTQVDALLGLDLSQRSDIDSSIKELISMREDARKTQDWAESDKLRENLINKGVDVKDTPHGPVWTKITRS